MSEPVPVILPPLDPTPSGGLLVLFSPGQWAWITKSLRAIYLAQDIQLRALGPLTEGVETIMATVAELQTALDANTAATDAAAAAITTEIAQLAAAIAALSTTAPPTQTQIDALNASTAKLTAATEALAADDPTP
jgi:hypothetical protein